MKGDPTFHPLPGKVVVELSEEENIGTLWLPQGAKRVRTMGRVIAINRDEDEGDVIYTGDTVLFGQNSGISVRIGRVEVLILRISEILTTLTWEESEDEA